MNTAAATLATAAQTLIVRDLGLQEYIPIWQAMRKFTDERNPQTCDELWLLSHPPVFTQGQAGKAEHLLSPGSIPVIRIDRGGQVTYHGPGQLICYLLLDVRRLGFGARELVNVIEKAIVECLASFDIVAESRTKAPGVYVKDAKIAALGLRIRKGCSYHGMSLNVAMDLTPFKRINPCGYQGLAVTNISDQLPDNSVWKGETLQKQVAVTLVTALQQQLGHTAFVNRNSLEQ